MENNENSNIFAIIDVEQINIRIYSSILIYQEWIPEYICLGKKQQIFRRKNLFVLIYLNIRIFVPHRLQVLSFFMAGLLKYQFTNGVLFYSFLNYLFSGI